MSLLLLVFAADGRHHLFYDDNRNEKSYNDKDGVYDEIDDDDKGDEDEEEEKDHDCDEYDSMNMNYPQLSFVVSCFSGFFLPTW